MGHRAGSRRVGGGAFAWCRGGWRRGGAHAQRVGVAGLARCVEVARFSRGGLGSWWGLHAVAGLVCGGLAPWRDLRAALGWRVARFSRGGLASKSGLHAVLGRRRSSVAASLAHRDRVVPADLRVAKGGGGGHGLRAARRRRWGLARLEGRDMGIGIMWWRGGGLRSRRVGERGSLQHWSEKKRKEEEKKHILLMCPRMRQWRRRDLQGLRGEARWRGGGLRTQHVGKRGLCNGQKRNEKKKKKNITLLAYPRMQAVAAAVGVGAKGKR